MKRNGKKPRIAIFTKPLDNWRSGSGHHLNEILSAVLDANAHDLDFAFVHYEHSDNPIYERVRELVVPRNPISAASVLQKERFDVVHYSPLTIYSPIWGIRSKKIATIHGAEQLLVPQYYGKVELAHESFVVPFYARRMDRIITVSNASADFFVERFKVKRERIVICYNGLSPAYRVLPAAEVTAPERLGVRRPFVFHVSRCSERKNPWTLLAGFAELVRRHETRHTLVCAGNGWESEEVAAKVRSLGIGDRFRATGFTSERDVVELMNAADCFVFPSLAEGFGMPNIEAMACGCPVVTTPGFAMREIVGDAALIVEDAKDPIALARAMFLVVSDADTRGRLLAAGKRRMAHFSWTDSAERLLDTYRELAEGG